ncbi:MAG TPA: site-2 protease family protein [Firmicutes bacterium]|nr:site-2 protease family protein [Bacillota bacterium]
MQGIVSILVTLPIILFALTVHEYAHGMVANGLGDPTARLQGRLTLNPLAHLDVIGTLMLIVTQRFGWAKPVPINPAYFRDWRKGIMLVGLAGPLANVTLAFIAALPLRFGIPLAPAIRFLLEMTVYINLGLAAFNLIPLPPLDGSRVVMGLLRGRYSYSYAQLEAYGPFILMLLILTGATGYIIMPIWFLLRRLVLGW